MNPTPQSPDDARLAEAARWAVRRDRGLSASEAIEFELWLAADERHATAMRSMSGAWDLLDRMPERVATRVMTDGIRRRARRTRFLAAAGLAAACLALGFWTIGREPVAPPAAVASLPARLLTLSDGSVVHANAGAEVTERFTPGERRVVLSRGEAHFTVTPDAGRPFIVEAGALQVRAVGTAFNVARSAARTEVLVTEGRVQLDTPATSRTGPTPGAAARPLVEAGQRAIVSSADSEHADEPPVISIATVDAAQIAQTLAWQQPLLQLGGAPLSEIVAEFERRTGQRVILEDPALAALRVGGRIRAHHADGFASLMGAALDLEVEHRADGALVLRKKYGKSR